MATMQETSDMIRYLFESMADPETVSFGGAPAKNAWAGSEILFQDLLVQSRWAELARPVRAKRAGVEAFSVGMS